MKVLGFILLIFVISCSPSSSSWHMGADSNKDGVRDDVEKWIVQKYSSSPNIKKAMLKLASVDPATCDFKYHTSCLRQVSNDALLIQLELLEKLLDTDERRMAFEKRLQKCSRKDDRMLNLKCDFN